MRKVILIILLIVNVYEDLEVISCPYRSLDCLIMAQEIDDNSYEYDTEERDALELRKLNNEVINYLNYTFPYKNHL